jgi:hypothetical protein
MSGAHLASALVGGASTPWKAAGFAVDAHGRIPFANGALEFTGTGEGLQGLSVAGVDGLPADIEGVPVRAGERVSAIEHPNGAFELDHVVIMTGSLERTSGVVTDLLGLELRRIRETPDVRQGFHRFADRGCIIEIVERPGFETVGLWGLVVNVDDIHAATALLGPEVIGLPKPAVQPGRFIATVRGSAGLGVAVAMMSPEPGPVTAG